VNDTLERIQRALDFVEAHLFEDVPLGAIAQRGACSPWHFHRLFLALTGETPAAYVWKRRLSEICRRLVETEQPIVDLALDCGFESQATLTRAFTRHVGVSPGRFRKQRRFSLPAYLYPPLDLSALVARRQRREFMEPRIVRKPALHVVGMAGRFTPSTTSRIPELWAQFVPRLADVPRRRGGHTLGVCLDADPATVEEAGFTYLAAVEVEAPGDVPAGLTAVTLPASPYAVFTHTGHISRLDDTVKEVWGRWLPRSRYRAVAAPDFELYDPARWNPATGEGDVDLYVPIAEE
jgi:AraC family transcriptional regulator